MAFTKVAAIENLPAGSLFEARVGEDTYAVCNVDGEVYAYDGVCPHAGGPLGQGALHGETLVCPWHAWEFNCRTGASDLDESLKLEKFPVKIENGDVLIDVSR
jgi:nitrite reductase (NADH) small subunit